MKPMFIFNPAFGAQGWAMPNHFFSSLILPTGMGYAHSIHFLTCEIIVD